MSPILIVRTSIRELTPNPGGLFHAVNIDELNPNLGQLITVNPTPQSLANQVAKNVKFVIEAHSDAIAGTPTERLLAGSVFEICNQTLRLAEYELAVIVN